MLPTKRLRHPFHGMLLLASVVTLILPAAEAGDWPQFRGPDRTGISEETKLLQMWPESGPQEIWRVPLGEGFSGISIAEDVVYTLFASGGDTVAVAYSAKDGALRWRTRIDKRWDDRYGNGPRATPTVDQGRVFVVSARGRLVALDAKSGKESWSVNLAKQYGAKPPTWGVSSSPLVDGKLLIVHAGGPESASIVAFDKTTGKEVWKALSDKPGYSAPISVTIDGTRQVVVFTGEGLVAVAPNDGTELWRKGWETSYGVNAATPILIGPNLVFVSSGYDVGAAVYRISHSDGGWIVQEVWKNRELKNKFSSSVLFQGHLYGFDEQTLKCVDAATGETRWRARGLGHGSLIVADGKLWIMGDRGQLALVEATPESYRLISEFEMFSGKTWTMPSLSNGVLFVRDENELVALRVAG